MAQHGSDDSTGLDQTAAGKIQTGYSRGDVAITNDDRDILRRLAAEVAEITGTAKMSETRDLWRRLNGLEKTRAIVFCDPENGWNEIITESQMRCVGKLA